jgi:sugar/nucleoside kinase (ribokinase family)
VVCHGLVASDFLVRAAFPVPRDRKVRVNEVVRQGGGPAANAAVALSRLGAKAAFVGAVGDDALGREQIEELARERVDVSNVDVVRRAASFVSLILVDVDGGARTIFSAPESRPLAARGADVLSPAPDLLLVDGWGGPAQLAAARAARERGVPVLLDAGSVRDDVLALLPLADVVIASEPFADEWMGAAAVDAPGAAVHRLLDEGAALAAVTRGARGALAGARGAAGLFEVEALPVDAVDTTGAGDAFHGGAACGLAAGGAWEESLRLAAFVAARKCTRPGAREGLPTRQDAIAAGLVAAAAGRVPGHGRAAGRGSA